MRFEAKHRFGKELASTVRNFNNICKTIAERTQIDLAYSLMGNRLFAAEDLVVNGTSALLCSLEPQLAECIQDGIGLSQYDEVHVSNSILIGHYQFKAGSCVVLRCKEGVPVFGQLSVIISVANINYFVCREFETVDYVEHLHAFSVRLIDTHVITATKQLKDHHPLGVHKVDFDGHNLLLIAPRYKLF